MPQIFPFKGVLPDAGLAESILKGKEFSSYPEISEGFQDYIKKGKIKQDKFACFYIYRQWGADRSFTGIWTSTSVSDLRNGSIRKHEKIHAERSEWVKNMFSDKKIDFNPVLITYPENQVLEFFLKNMKERSPFLRVLDPILGTGTEVWRVEKEAEIEFIQKEFQKIPRVYLADGHHRAAAFESYIDEMGKGQMGVNEPGFSSIYFSLKEVELKPYHRLVRLFDPRLLSECMHMIEREFELHPLHPFKVPKKKGNFVLVNADRKIYSMKLKKDSRFFREFSLDTLSPEETVQNLDVIILQESIFNTILQLHHNPLGTLDFIGGNQDIENLIFKVFKGDYSMAFLLSPPEFQEIRIISDHGLTMPPKSTYFEPKIPSGLIIQNFEGGV